MVPDSEQNARDLLWSLSLEEHYYLKRAAAEANKYLFRREGILPIFLAHAREPIFVAFLYGSTDCRLVGDLWLPLQAVVALYGAQLGWFDLPDHSATVYVALGKPYQIDDLYKNDRSIDELFPHGRASWS